MTRPEQFQRSGPEIEFITNGNIFLTEKKILTVPVNLQGVMGKGLALSVKKLYPDVYEVYRDLCSRQKISQGTPYLFKYKFERWFLFFPTKRRWQQRSQLIDIEQGLTWIQTNADNLNITSIAFPALGCGLGGLDWSEVKPVILERLANFKGEIEIYEPY